MPVDDRPVLRLAHSPDPDDAFMWWPLFSIDGEAPRLETGRFRFEPVMEDIESLNRRSLTGDLEITAISCAQFPHVADRYALTACGASMGDGYGPKLVTREPMTRDEFLSRTLSIAIPGRRTTAYSALIILAETSKRQNVETSKHAVGATVGHPPFTPHEVPFETVIDQVASGAFDAGLVIHEGQLTYEQAGLHLVADLGAWWMDVEGLPLPLGVNTVRRDLEDRFGPGTLAEVTALLRQSVEYALANREASIAYALRFARGMPAELADRFVHLYVNRWTLDFGDDGRAAVRRFLKRCHACGLAPPLTEAHRTMV